MAGETSSFLGHDGVTVTPENYEDYYIKSIEKAATFSEVWDIGRQETMSPIRDVISNDIAKRIQNAVTEKGYALLRQIQVGDTVDYQGYTWTVEGIDSPDEQCARIQLSRETSNPAMPIAHLWDASLFDVAEDGVFHSQSGAETGVQHEEVHAGPTMRRRGR